MLLAALIVCPVLGSEPAKDAQLLLCAVAFAGGDGTRALIFWLGSRPGGTLAATEHAPFRDEYPARIVPTIGEDFRAKRCALTLDESLQMMSPKDSFYKDFAMGQSCVPAVKPSLS